MSKKVTDVKTKVKKSAGKKAAKKATKKNASNGNGNGKKMYKGIVTDPFDRKITGNVYLEDDNYTGAKYGTIIIIGVLAALAAIISPLGNAIISQWGLTGQYVADVWWAIVGTAAFAGGAFAAIDKMSEGKY